MRLRLIRVDLPLRHFFTNSRREISTVRTIIVELEQDGLRGHGEFSEDVFYGAVVEDAYAQLAQLQDKLEYYALADPIAFWRFVQPQLENSPFIQCALDCAACDLWGKMKNKPLWKIWGYSKHNLPNSSFSIPIDSVERMTDRINEFPNWSAYRLKLGTRFDIDTLGLLRSKTNAAFYVDVNGGWTLEKAIEMLEPLQKHGVSYLEQPLNAHDWDGMAKLQAEKKKRKINIPIFADESWKTPADIGACAKVFDGINIKILKCGGLTPVRDVIGSVRNLGLKVAVANTIESAVGASASSQLAPLADFVGLDGPLHIDKKIGHGIVLMQGQIHYPAEGGTGVKVILR